MYYLIGTTLEPSTKEDILKTDKQAVAILHTDEWNSLTARPPQTKVIRTFPRAGAAEMIFSSPILPVEAG